MKFSRILCYLAIHRLRSDVEYNKIEDDFALKNHILPNHRMRCLICNNYCDYDGGVF